MAKKDDELLFGRKREEISELMLEGTGASLPDVKHYVNQPTSARIPAVMGNVPEGRFQEQVVKGSDEAKADAVDAHPVENQPAMGVPDKE